MPKGKPRVTCGDHGGHRQNGNECGRPEGWGTDFDTGKCRDCRGTSPDGKSHEGNQNATSHGAYADQSNLYSDVFSDAEREIADEIFEDYHDTYTELHGSIPAGHELRLFKIAVNAVTEIRVENWATEKPEDLHTEAETPHIDRETHISESGQRYYRYKKSPALAAAKTLSNENRKWLKDLGLLDDPESAKADAAEGLISVLSRARND